MHGVNKEDRSSVQDPLQTAALTDQVYLFEDNEGWQWVWNVTTALHLAQSECEPVILFLEELEITQDFVRSQYPGLDESYALTTDLSRPILMIPFRDKVRIADGWHRLFHAATVGQSQMLAYVLTQEQADACLVSKLPPGQGIPLTD